MSLREGLALTWAQMAQAELGAENRFQNLIHEMRALDVPAQVISMAEFAQIDEIRHAKLCSSVAKRLGHKSGFAYLNSTSIAPSKTWKNLASREEKLICEIVLMCCITETINSSLLATISNAINERTQTGRIIKTILTDEIKHGQIGWAFLNFVSHTRDLTFLAEHLDCMLEISVRDELFLQVEEKQGKEDSYRFGVLPESERLDQFMNSLTHVVIPGFDKFGINTNNIKSWLASKAPDSIPF